MESKSKMAAKPKRGRPKKNSAKKPAAKPLPPPMEIDQSPAPIPIASQEEGGGLLSGIASLFDSPSRPNQEPSQSRSGATSSTSEPLSAESERLLRAVPDSIGDGGEGEVLSDGGALPEGDAIAALMSQIAFEPQDVQDTVCEFFDWLSERFESDHWKLTDRQARMLGRPTAQMLNSIWTKLQAYLPDILARWFESTPGATAFILACGIVVVPKITKQVQISRQGAKEKPLVPESPKPQPVRVPVPEKRAGIVVE